MFELLPVLVWTHFIVVTAGNEANRSTANTFTVKCNAVITVEYLGCFHDCFTASCMRMLDDPQVYTLYETNTVDNCVVICWENGYLVAGVAKGYECMCSSSVPEGILQGYVTRNDGTACKKPCAGDQTITCGDHRHVQAYRLQ